MARVVIPDPGDVIAGRYRLDEVLGRGGFGMVFKATHLDMNRPVALKTLLPQAALESVEVERFRQEAVLASSLTHPNTITLFDYGQTEDGVFYLVMEFLRGETLKQRLQRVGAMSVDQAQQITLQVLKSLSEAHSLGIVHRDLKPENIFLSEMPGERDFVKVLDFGVAKMLSGDDAAPDLDRSIGATFGTPRYMAPEQISAQPVGAYTDMYALGLIGFEMLTGQPAVNGRTPLEIITHQVHQQPPLLPDSVRHTPLGRMVANAIQKDPTRRFQHASAALDLLMESAPVHGSLGRADAIPSAGWSNVDMSAVVTPSSSSSLIRGGGAAAASAATPSHSNMPVAFSAAAQNSYMSESTLDAVDMGDGGFEDDGATRIQDPGWLDPAMAPIGRNGRAQPKPLDSSAFMAETPMADFGGGFGDDDSTRVHQPYASEPTQMVSAHDIIEGQALSNLMSETPLLDEGDDFDSAPTRVSQGRVDPRKAVAATLAAKRAATARAAKRAVADQRRSVPMRPPLESSHKILDTESTDPEVIAAPTNSREAIPAIPLPDRPVTPTPSSTEASKPEDPGASYLGPALNVPGNTNDVIAPMFAKASHTPTVFSPPATYNQSGNRRMLLAASVFVLGVCALMLMVVLYLLLPSEPTQPIATAEPNAASSNLKGSTAAASPAETPKANTPSPNKGDDSAASPSKDSPSEETPSAAVASATVEGKEPAAENSEETPAKTEGAEAEAAESETTKSETAESDTAEDTAPEAPTGPAILTVASEPKGASVYVDGRFAGLAPVELTQSDTQGTVTLLLKKEGYREERQVVQYEGSRTVEIALKSTAVAHKQESPAPTTQDSPADHNEKAPVAEEKAKTTTQTQTATQTKAVTQTKTTKNTQAKTPKKPATSAKTTTTAAKPKKPTPKKPKAPKKPSGKKAFEKW